MVHNVTILGAGSWGTALSIVLANKGHKVNLWGRKKEHIENLIKNHENSKYLPGIEIPQSINCYSDIGEALNNSEIIILAVASQAIRDLLKGIKPYISNQIFVSVSKGIENSTLMRISEIVKQFYPNNKFVVLSGPTHAEEVSKGIPSAIVSASECQKTAELIQDLFITSSIRVYTSPDVVSVEIGGALKNVIALGAGISDGLGYGDNTKAAIMTRGISEIARLGDAMGGKISTFAGLSGIGDLIVTCTSMHSRNRRCGILLGQGKSLDEAVSSIGMVVEGVYTTKSAYELAERYEIEMPILNEIYNILYNGISARESVDNLMLRSKTHEVEEW